MHDSLVQLRLQMEGGHTQNLELSQDSPELVELFQVLSDRSSEFGGSTERFFQLPIDGGREAFSFHSSTLIAISSRPPVVAQFDQDPAHSFRRNALNPDAALSGEKLMKYLSDVETLLADEGKLALIRPVRCRSVRQGRIQDQLFLEVGPQGKTITLNPSAAAIWDLCDGQRSVLEIAQELQARFDLPIETMAADVAQATRALKLENAINLEPAAA